MVVGGLMLGLWALRAWWAFMLFLARHRHSPAGLFARPRYPAGVSSAVRNLGLMVMGHPIPLIRTRVACGIDFGAIAAQAGVWEGITTHPRQSMRDLQVV